MASVGAHRVCTRRGSTQHDFTRASLSALCALFALGCGGRDAAPLPPHAPFGLPSAARPGDARHWLVVNEGYLVSFDTTKKTPEWVAWRTSDNDLGFVPRCDCFAPEPALPLSSQPSAASFVGFDRGHLCPSQDRTRDSSANRETYRYGNALAQTHELNTGPWEELEREARDRARAGAVVYAVAGPILRRGVVLADGTFVAAEHFKALLIWTPGRIERLAAIFPNRPDTTSSWRHYQVSMAELEARSGLLFFPLAPR